MRSPRRAGRRHQQQILVSSARNLLRRYERNASRASQSCGAHGPQTEPHGSHGDRHHRPGHEPRATGPRRPGREVRARNAPAGPSRYRSGSSASTPSTRAASTGFATSAAASHSARMPLIASDPISTQVVEQHETKPGEHRRALRLDGGAARNGNQQSDARHRGAGERGDGGKQQVVPEHAGTGRRARSARRRAETRERRQRQRQRAVRHVWRAAGCVRDSGCASRCSSVPRSRSPAIDAGAHQHRDERREQQAQVHQRGRRPAERLDRQSGRAVEPGRRRRETECAEQRGVADQPAAADRVAQFLAQQRVGDRRRPCARELPRRRRDRGGAVASHVMTRPSSRTMRRCPVSSSSWPA